MCYRVEEKRELLHGINEFLDDVSFNGFTAFANILTHLLPVCCPSTRRLGQEEPAEHGRDDGHEEEDEPEEAGEADAGGGAGGQ